MLSRLNIFSFAIIDHLEIDFQKGLNILSGETGAGKSIIMSAVNLILGARASVDLIRSGAREAKIEALFDLPDNPTVNGLMEKIEVPFDGEMLIKRIISREGKNRITINGTIATLQMLAGLGARLISISGQHEHHLLLRPENHLYILDDFGGLRSERLELEKFYKAFQTRETEIEQLERLIKEGEERLELTAFQVKEIESARLKAREEEDLEAERKRLQHGEQLMEIVRSTHDMLYERDDSVLSALSHCEKRMDSGVRIDPRLSAIRDNLSAARIELEDLALELRNQQKDIVINPGRLEAVEERVQLISRLKKKYGPSIEDILNFGKKLSHKAENLDRKKVDLEILQSERAELKEKILAMAMALSKSRRKAARDLEKSVKKELQHLTMGETRFEVGFFENEGKGAKEEGLSSLTAQGFERIEFFISPNVGEALKPLFKIASGGELSRIMLALKTILARGGSVETLVFDEVDTGIGGATAEVVGDKLQSLAEYHQILCITHLPQIASKGETHFLVMKDVQNGRTLTSLAQLDIKERVREIARLLGGKEISKQALAHAEEMLNP